MHPKQEALRRQHNDAPEDRPAGFDPSAWRILKDGKHTVAAEHIPTGIQRKIAKSWFSS